MALCFEALSEVSDYLKLIKDPTIRWVQLQCVNSSTDPMVSCISAKADGKEPCSLPYLEIFQQMHKETSRKLLSVCTGSFFPLKPGKDYYKFKSHFIKDKNHLSHFVLFPCSATQSDTPQ